MGRSRRLNRHPSLDPVAHHHRLGSDQRGELIKLPFGANLLKGPDRDIRQNPRNKASFHDANVIVSTPNTSRIPFGTVNVFARRILA